VQAMVAKDTHQVGVGGGRTDAVCTEHVWRLACFSWTCLRPILYP
jgi:hypothetical protein